MLIYLERNGIRVDSYRHTNAFKHNLAYASAQATPGHRNMTQINLFEQDTPLQFERILI